MNVLIIGLGSIAKKHIAALREIGKFNIYALRSSTTASEVENVINIFSLKEVEEVRFDFVIVSNPTSQHASYIEDLIALKVPLFIEKPIFEEISDKNSSLVERIEGEQINSYVACNLRFLECLKKIREILRGERVNEVNVYCGSYLPEWRPVMDFRKVYSANKEMGGGVHIDLIHELDYLYWIFGRPENIRKSFRSNSSLDISAVDYANYLWEYESFSANVILNYYRRDTKRTLEILTANSTYLVDILENKIFEDGTEIFSSAQRIKDTYKAQMEFFIKEIVTGRQKDFNSAREGYSILQLCLKD